MHMCLCVHICDRTHLVVRGEDILQKSVLFFHSMGPRDKLRSSSLVVRAFLAEPSCLLNYLSWKEFAVNLQTTVLYYFTIYLHACITAHTNTHCLSLSPSLTEFSSLLKSRDILTKCLDDQHCSCRHPC